MSDAADSGQDNAASGSNAEGDAGTGSSDKKSSDQEMVPRARLDAALERDRQRDVELAELRGLVEGMKGQGSSGGGETTYTRPQLMAMVEDDKITEAEAEQILADQQKGEIKQIVTSTVQELVTSDRKRSKAEAEIDKYANALPDVLAEGTGTRDKYVSELRYLGSLGHDTKKEETILIAMRAAFGPIERLNINPGNGKRATVQDTTSAGDGENQTENDGKTPRWPAWMDSAQRDYFQKQVDSGYYKDRADCLGRIKGSEDNLKRGAAKRRVAA